MKLFLLLTVSHRGNKDGMLRDGSSEFPTHSLTVSEKRAETSATNTHFETGPRRWPPPLLSSSFARCLDEPDADSASDLRLVQRPEVQSRERSDRRAAPGNSGARLGAGIERHYDERRPGSWRPWPHGRCWPWPRAHAPCRRASALPQEVEDGLSQMQGPPSKGESGVLLMQLILAWQQSGGCVTRADGDHYIYSYYHSSRGLFDYLLRRPFPYKHWPTAQAQTTSAV